MQEPVTASPAETLPTPPAPEPAIPEPAPQTDAPAEIEAPAEDTPSVVFDPEAFKDTPEFQTYREELESEAHRQGQIREFGRRKELVEHHQRIADGIDNFNAAIGELAATGAVDAKSISQLVRQHAPSLNAYADYNAARINHVKDEHGAYVAASWIAEATRHPDVNAPELAEKYVQRLIRPNGVDANNQPVFTYAPEFEIDGGAKVFDSFVKDLVKTVRSEADAKGYERGLKAGREGSEEAVKTASRDGKGPASVSGTAGVGNKPYSKMTPEERAAMTPEERDAAARAESG